ncbi:MAG: acetylglutamate kinase [Oscillospiraceae bacterium]|nr:acetylglutamate kinase [Oscillospiraceae bacterium]
MEPMEQMELMGNIPNRIRSQVLIDALPYIQRYNQKIIVVKYGGNAMTNEALKEAVMSDIVLLSLVGIRVVLVHGGGPEISDMLHRLNIESRFVGGLRYTDAETAEVVRMVLAGKVNKELVSHLTRHQGKALGLCGIDGELLRATKKESKPDVGLVGEITDVNTKPILMALDNGYIPVIATVACGADGQVYNVNADTAAAAIAAALGAENLILMTDIAGLLRDKNDPATLIPSVSISEVQNLKKQGIISGGMIPKIDCCVEAIRRGVKKAVIIDGRVPHSILVEICSNEGVGTQFLSVY